MSIYTPYTYLIGWSQHQKYYYGVRFAKGCHPNDFWSEYFTSSTKVAEYREQHGEPDVIQIRKTFHNREAAIAWENKVLRRMNVIGEDHWMNQAAFPVFDSRGRPRTPEHLRKMRASALKGAETTKKQRTGKTWDELYTQDQIKRLLKGVQKAPSEETRLKMSQAAKERSKRRLCCIVCQKELPSNSLASHSRFCN